MNVLISGPFGCGSLMDEMLLAGMLAHFKTTRHTVSVLSASAERTKTLHGGVPIDYLPEKILSNRPLWAAFERSHLQVVTSAGPLSDLGEVPARKWLQILELAQKTGMQAAVSGVWALPLENPRERARIQRFLHNFTEALSVRDDFTKKTLIAFGVNANIISANGSPILGLATPSGKPAAGRLALIVTPRRSQFGAEETIAGPFSEAIARIAEEWLAVDKDRSILIVRDASPSAETAFGALKSAHGARVATVDADAPVQKTLESLARCQLAVAFDQNALVLASVCGVPAVVVDGEPGLADAARVFGAQDLIVPATEWAAALPQKLADALNGLAERRAALLARIAILKKKEMQNLRALEAIVPRRVEYARDQARAKDSAEVEEAEAEEAPPPAPKRAGPRNSQQDRSHRGSFKPRKQRLGRAERAARKQARDGK